MEGGQGRGIFDTQLEQDEEGEEEHHEGTCRRPQHSHATLADKRSLTTVHTRPLIIARAALTP